ncbi:MAG: hypothetical protein GY868_01355, partial [Deltaproteobacteria bacterium]|nr:hypothetical protein [Deltaproteobacteria bacterium]
MKNLHFITAALLVAVLSQAGCLSSGLGKKKQSDDQLLFSQAQKALDARDHEDAIRFFQLFTKKFPESEEYSWALQRLGESFEGLLEAEYLRRIENGEPEPAARAAFTDRYEHYACWDQSTARLRYNLSHYKEVLEKFPDSPIADESAYRSVPWQQNYHAKPEGPLLELEHLEDIIERYPSTSFRYEILYKMAYRCHVLYEIYSFSHNTPTRNREAA